MVGFMICDSTISEAQPNLNTQTWQQNTTQME